MGKFPGRFVTILSRDGLASPQTLAKTCCASRGFQGRLRRVSELLQNEVSTKEGRSAEVCARVCVCTRVCRCAPLCMHVCETEQIRLTSSELLSQSQTPSETLYPEPRHCIIYHLFIYHLSIIHLSTYLSSSIYNHRHSLLSLLN